MNKLTKREKTIIQELSKGLSNRDIAKSLGLADQTVRTYLYWMFKKHGVKNRLQLLLLAKDNGWV